MGFISRPSGGPFHFSVRLHPGMWLFVQILLTTATAFESVIGMIKNEEQNLE